MARSYSQKSAAATGAAVTSDVPRIVVVRRSGKALSARKGRLQLTSETARASFNLADVKFRYGPMQTWPRWPSPAIVEVLALRAEFANGYYLALAEGLRPEAIPMPSLPA